MAVVVPLPEAVRSIAAGSSSTCALLQSGRVLCWGDTWRGQLGSPLLWQSNVPRLVTQ